MQFGEKLFDPLQESHALGGVLVWTEQDDGLQGAGMKRLGH